MAIIMEMGKKPYYWPPVKSPTDVTVDDINQALFSFKTLEGDIKPVLIITNESGLKVFAEHTDKEMIAYKKRHGERFSGALLRFDSIPVKVYKTDLLSHMAAIVAAEDGYEVHVFLP